MKKKYPLYVIVALLIVGSIFFIAKGAINVKEGKDKNKEIDASIGIAEEIVLNKIPEYRESNTKETVSFQITEFKSNLKEIIIINENQSKGESEYEELENLLNGKVTVKNAYIIENDKIVAQKYKNGLLNENYERQKEELINQWVLGGHGHDHEH